LKKADKFFSEKTRKKGKLTWLAFFISLQDDMNLSMFKKR